MSKIDEITRESWIMGTFPEWGTWLNEEIENEEVKPGTVAMWWLGCTGMWFKTPAGCNITVDLLETSAWASGWKKRSGSRERFPCWDVTIPFIPASMRSP